MKKSKVLAMFIALVFASYVNGGNVLDQSQPYFGQDTSTAVRVYSTRSLCQTFTAGLSGKLVQVDLRFTDNSTYPLDQSLPATISIVNTTAGVPNGEILWSNSYSNLSKGWFTVSISNSIPFLRVGGVYGIQVECLDTVVGEPDNFWDVARDQNFYTRGQFLDNKYGSWAPFRSGAVTYTNADAVFRTYISPDRGTVVSFR